ncbi:hypothetical protein BKA70DRAFT_1218580 [Coprinopsis sp. MPI-PUGE-AT-0042]|nr:hypothetical protein BKA70DRAFT_1218580 [Coprinopsis sp. MPI-PUGE-AT-0042]
MLYLSKTPCVATCKQTQASRMRVLRSSEASSGWTSAVATLERGDFPSYHLVRLSALEESSAGAKGQKWMPSDAVNVMVQPSSLMLAPFVKAGDQRRVHSRYNFPAGWAVHTNIVDTRTKTVRMAKAKETWTESRACKDPRGSSDSARRRNTVTPVCDGNYRKRWEGGELWDCCRDAEVDAKGTTIIMRRESPVLTSLRGKWQCQREQPGEDERNRVGDLSVSTFSEMTVESFIDGPFMVPTLRSFPFLDFDGLQMDHGHWDCFGFHQYMKRQNPGNAFNVT